MYVQKALANLMVGRTTFVIAHRLATIRRADKILVLEDGQIRESGTHTELMARGGTYARLHDLQFADDDMSGARSDCASECVGTGGTPMTQYIISNRQEGRMFIHDRLRAGTQRTKWLGCPRQREECQSPLSRFRNCAFPKASTSTNCACGRSFASEFIAGTSTLT